MSRFTRADHRFAKDIRVDLGEDAPPPDDELSDESADRLIAAMDSGKFDDECGEPTIREWQEHSDQVEKEATQFHRNWKATERHLGIVTRRNGRLIKSLVIAMVMQSVCLMGIAIHFLRWHWN